MEEVLSQIEILVVIGWSMRKSDKKYEDLFARAASRRRKKLDLIAVCNFHQKENFYSRFKNLLPAEKFLCCDEGFITKEAEDLLEKVAKLSQ